MDSENKDTTGTSIPMDEAPKDPGIQTTHHSYTDKDFEGNYLLL